MRITLWVRRKMGIRTYYKCDRCGYEAVCEDINDLWVALKGRIYCPDCCKGIAEVLHITVEELRKAY